MDQLQANLYKLLVEMDEICQRNGIEYYLAGGTALGAIRGGGFLPWDDDIDLYITRDNWNRLVKVMETETPEDRVFVCTENSDYYYNPVGRYVDKNTTVMMKSQILCGKACGQLIEFFVFDPMPRGEVAEFRHRRNVKTYCEILSPFFVLGRHIFYENVEYDYDYYKQYHDRVLKVGKEQVLKELLDKISSTPVEDADNYCMCWGQRTLIYGVEMLGKPRLEKFEDGMFPVPAQQEKVARVAYGNSWMYVPEGEGKVVHDLDKDLMTPFQQYVDIYMPLLDKEALMKSYDENKQLRVEALPKKELFKRDFAKARIMAAADYILNNDYDIRELRQLLEQKNFKELGRHLAYFYQEQGNPDVKTNGLLIPMPDDYIYLTIMHHVMQGAYYKADNIMKFRCEQQDELSEDLKKAKAMMDFCRDCSVAVYDDMDEEAAIEILKAHPEYSDVLLDYPRTALWILARRDSEGADLLREAENFIALFGEDGELLRFKGLALFRLGRASEAKETYEKAIRRTRNGFVWKEAGELFGIDAYEEVDKQDELDEDEIEEQEVEDDD